VALGFGIALVRPTIRLGELDRVGERGQQSPGEQVSVEHHVDLDAEHSHRGGHEQEREEAEDQREHRIHLRRLGDDVADVRTPGHLQHVPQHRDHERAGQGPTEGGAP
jgi:hypothetical protein